MASPQLSDNAGQNLGSFLSGGGSDMGILPREEQQQMVRESYKAGKESSAKQLKLADEIGDVEKSVSGLVPPTPAKLPEAPKETQTDPWKTFGSAAMFVSTLGSLMTRRPLTNGLNAAAGMLNAQRAGDDAEYKKQMDLYKVNTDNAFKQADFEMSTYKAIMENKTLSINAKKAQMAAVADAFKSENLSGVLANRGWGEGVKFVEAYDKQLERAKEADRKARGGEITLTPEALDKIADAVGRDGARINQFLGYGDRANKTAVLDRIAEKYPDADLAGLEAGYGGKQSELRALGTSAGKLTLAANALDSAIPVAQQALSGLDLSEFPSFNAFENYARKNTGDPNITKAYTALQAVISDYSGVIARGGQQTDSTRAAAREIVNENMAKGQIQGAFDIMQQESGNLKQAIQTTKKEAMGSDKPSSKAESADDSSNEKVINGVTYYNRGGGRWQIKE